MISAEAPVLFAKAAQIFITELTLRAWIHTEDNKRRTLQVKQLLPASSCSQIPSQLLVSITKRLVLYTATCFVHKYKAERLFSS